MAYTAQHDTLSSMFEFTEVVEVHNFNEGLFFTATSLLPTSEHPTEKLHAFLCLFLLLPDGSTDA